MDYKATHNLVSLNGSAFLVKRVARTTCYTNTVIKFVPKKCKTATYQKYQNFSDLEDSSQHH